MAVNTNGAGGVRINPANGSEITVEAGQTVTLVFDVANESPEIVSYHILAEQVPSEWIADAPVMDTAPGTNDRVRVVLRPFVNAMEGVYPMRLSVAADGSIFASVTLSLRVLPAPAVPIPTAPVTPEPPKLTPPVAVPPEPLATEATEPTLTFPVPDFAALKATPPPTIPPPVETVQTPVVQPLPVTPPPPPVRPVVPVTPPTPVIPVTDEFSDFTYQPHTQETATDEPDERNVVVTGAKDSSDGEVFTVAPGQTLLVRLTVQNEGAFTRNYVLEDDQLLPVNWLDLRQYDISLDRNALGELRFRLTPPANAEPGAYPFGVRFGPSDAARRVRQFTLLIPALPAVRVSSEKPAITSPFGTGHETEFALQVVSVGNADTAFRIGVVAAGVAQAGANPDALYLYESAQWRYLFDREIEEVRVPENRQAARPETVRFRMARKGIWWLGWREKHQVTVAATPVMTGAQIPGEAATPGSAPGGETTLTLHRWRVLPFPAFVTVPLVLLLLPILGGGARDIVVENGVQGTAVPSSDTATENLYYVLQNQPVTVDPAKPAKQMTADLGWTASAGAWLSLWTDKSRTLASGPFVRGYADTTSVPEYGVTRNYTVGSLWSRQSVTARFLPLRTNALQIIVRQGKQVLSPKTFNAPGGIDGGGREYVLPRTGGPATVSLRNGYPNGLDVIVWEATNSGGAGVTGIATVDAKRLLPLTTLPTITIAPPRSGSAEVVLLTTDAKAQLVRFRFE